MPDEKEIAEPKLKKEEIYSRLYRDLPVGVVAISNQNIIYVNKAMAKMIDVPKNRLLEWTIDDLLKLLLDEDRKSAEEMYAFTPSSQAPTDIVRFRFMHRTKGIRYLEIIPTVFEYGEEADYIGLISDVTENIESIEKIRESRDKLTLYREIFERSSDAIALIDTNGQFIEQNDAHRFLFGYADSFLRGRTPEIFMGGDEFRDMLKILKKDETYGGEHTASSRKGREMIIDVSAFAIKPSKSETMNYIIINRDITAKAKADENLRKSEREKSAILHSMSDHVNFYNPNEMRIVWTNTAAAASLNLTPDDIVGKFCYELWHGRKTPCEDCPVIRARDMKKPQENEVYTPDGRIWYIKGYPVIDDKGNVTGVVEITREITEQKKAAEETKEARARAELFNDLMAHDLNNINQGIMGSLELILMQESIPSEIKEALESALEQVKRGVTLISNVRKFSNIDREPASLEKMDIYPPIIEAITSVQNSFPKKKFKVSNHVKHNRVFILGDEFLADAFYNILHNSAKHNEGPLIRIDIKAVHENDSEYFDLVFDDFGPGIQDNLKKKILTRFSEGGQRGSGLGLTLVQRIIERYHGSVIVNDRIKGDSHKGTQVTLRLPLAV